MRSKKPKSKKNAKPKDSKAKVGEKRRKRKVIVSTAGLRAIG